MEKIDRASWKRAEVYDFFSSVSNPHYSITFRVDVTALYRFCKQTGSPFYLSMIYLCTRALDSVENFRYTERDGEIFLLDGRNPSFTDLRPGEDQFRIVTVPMTDGLDTFIAAAEEKRNTQKCFIDLGAESDDLIYFSCVPRLRMTGLAGERDILNPATRVSNIPSLTWGKYEQVGDRVELCMCMEANHRFIDGLHVSLFAERLEALIAEL